MFCFLEIFVIFGNQKSQPFTMCLQISNEHYYCLFQFLEYRHFDIHKRHLSLISQPLPLANCGLLLFLFQLYPSFTSFISYYKWTLWWCHKGVLDIKQAHKYAAVRGFLDEPCQSQRWEGRKNKQPKMWKWVIMYVLELALDQMCAWQRWWPLAILHLKARKLHLRATCLCLGSH